MFTCGLVRSNFSLAMAKLLWPGSGAEGRCAQFKKPGAGSGNRTRVFSLEGCCTTIVLYPHEECGCTALRLKSDVSAPDSYLDSGPEALKRVVGEVRLESTKLTQGIYSPPPLPLGTFPQRAMSMPVWKRLRTIFRSFRYESLRCRATPAVEEAPEP